VPQPAGSCRRRRPSRTPVNIFTTGDARPNSKKTSIAAGQTLSPAAYTASPTAPPTPARRIRSDSDHRTGQIPPPLT
jgi:hypothetical protein